jgi:hypothetical protein
MKHGFVLATLGILATANFASAAGTVVTVDGNRLSIVSADGKSTIRCDKLVFTPASKDTTTISVVDGMVQLKNADVTATAAELRLAELPDKFEVIGNGTVSVTNKADNAH